MTELVLTVENESILPSLKKVLGSIEGVRVKKMTRKKKTGLELAIEDVEAGRVTEWNSVDEMFNTVLGDEI